MPEEEALQQADLYWRQTNMLADGYNVLNKRQMLQPGREPMLFNHFEGFHCICTKTNLIRSLKSYYETHQAARDAGYQCFDTTPTTFVISRATDEREVHNFMQRFREIANGGSQKERVPVKHCEENMWVVKPAALNQGRGIEVFRNVRDVLEFIFKKQ